VITFKVGHDSADTVPVAIGLAEFKRLVEERTGGGIVIEVYNNGTLGSASDYVVNCQLGTLDMGTVNQSVVSSFIPDLPAVDIPYIIESYEHADKVFMGEVGKYYSQEVRDIVGIEVVGIWEVGFRNLTNSKRPVNNLKDVAGLRIRTMDNQVHQTFWKGLGADPVPMSWNEAYTAMQQGAIDGQENPFSVILGNKVAEVNNNLAVTEHVYSSQFVIMSDKAWKSLNDEQRKIIVDSCYEAGLLERKEQRRQASEAVARLEEQGMSVTYPDKQEFIDASAKICAEYRRQYEKVVKMIEDGK
jgi:tripartite ATP-independent transporter DctP family solute receptor